MTASTTKAATKAPKKTKKADVGPGRLQPPGGDGEAEEHHHRQRG